MAKILFFLGILTFFLIFPFSTGKEFQPTGTQGFLIDPGGATPQQSLQMRTVTVVVPTPTPTPRQCQPGDNVAVDLLLDMSTSMKQYQQPPGPPYKLDQLKDAVLAFSQKLQNNDDVTGIQVFSDYADEVLPLGPYDINTFIEKVSQLDTIGRTNMREGFVVAKAAIERVINNYRQHNWALILVSDGVPNEGYPQDPRMPPNIPQQIKELGVLVVTIGLGQDAYPALLEEIASPKPTGGKYYYFSPSGAELEGIYNEIASAVLCR